MPVHTRSTFGVDGSAQPIGMVADSGHDSNVNEHTEHSQHTNQQQPTIEEMRMAALLRENAELDVKLHTAKKTLMRMSPKSPVSGAARPRGTPQPRRTSISSGNTHSRARAASVGRERPAASPSSAPRPRATTGKRPSPMPALNLDDGESIGETIGRSVAHALEAHGKEKTGSFITKEEAAHMTSDLEVSERSTFKTTIKTKSSLTEPRVRDLMAIKYEGHEDYRKQIQALGLAGVDARLASTVYKCLKDKEKAPYVALLIGATEKDDILASSGRLMLDWIDKETEEGMRDDPKTLKTIFDATPFFTAEGMLAQNKVSGMKLLKAIEALPLKYTSDTYDKYELVMEKIPGHLHEEHWVKDLHLGLRRAKRDRGAAPWSLERLCDEIADELKNAAPSPSANTARGAHPVERAKDIEKKTDDGGKRARKLAGKTLTGKIGKWIQGRGKGQEHQFTFIKIDGDKGGDVFAHKSSVEGAEIPKEGDKVTFEIVHGSFMDGAECKEYAVSVKRAGAKPIANAAAVQTEEDGGGDSGDESDDYDGVPPLHYRAIVT